MSAALFYVQHLLGIGHLKRSSVLVRAMTRHDLRVTVVSGGMPVPGIDFGPAELVQLPALRASDAESFTLVDAAGRPPDRGFWRRRRSALCALLTRVDPQALVVEMFPFGRLALRREIVPLLRRAGRRRCTRISSVRDILVESPQSKNQRMRRFAMKYFERILVHSDPSLVTFDQSFPAAAELQDKLVYTGYVVGETTAPPARRGGGVLVSAGGGAVGESLLRTALAARPLTRFAHRPWRLLSGHGLAESVRAELARRAPEGVVVETFREDFPALLADAEVSVSQAGYNTVAELLALRVPAVLVPFSHAEETEQSERARLLAERGLVQLVAEPDLTPAALAAAIDRAAPPAEGLAVDLDGAERAALAVREAVDRRARGA